MKRAPADAGDDWPTGIRLVNNGQCKSFLVHIQTENA
jgi:hypothetical protein